jgi:hypothetical protein
MRGKLLNRVIAAFMDSFIVMIFIVAAGHIISR